MLSRGYAASSLLHSQILRIPLRNWVLPWGARRFDHTLPNTIMKRNQDKSLMHQKLLSLKPIKPNDTFISCTIFNSRGNIVDVSHKFNKWKYLRDHSLYPRDLRKIDTSSVDIIPSILVKPHCIVVNLLHIKALIESDKVYIFDTTNPASAIKLGVLMYDMESRLSSLSNKNSTNYNNNNSKNKKIINPGQNFEHRALECILINVMSVLETEFKLQATICKKILFELENEVNRDKLRELLIKSKNLSSFYQKSYLIREVLDELLESDDDLEMMYLNENNDKLHIKKHNSDVDIYGDDDDFAEVEMLLENYYTQCDEFVQQAASLIEDIKSTEEIVNIILDANRNSLMLLELKVTIYTLGFTVASLLPAFYGMNLKNFIEESVWGFSSVVIFSILAALWVTRANFRALKAVTRLSMFKNITPTNIPNQNVSTTKRPLLRKLQKRKPIPRDMDEEKLLAMSPWIKFKNLSKSIWFGSSYYSIQNRKHWTNEEKDMVWKWLIQDKKD